MAAARPESRVAAPPAGEICRLSAGELAHRIRERQLLLAGQETHRAFETGGVAGGEKLLRIGGAALAAKFLGHGKIDAEQAIVSLDMACAAADGASLGRIECGHLVSPYFNLYTIN